MQSVWRTNILITLIFFHLTKITKRSCESYSGSAGTFPHMSITSLTLSDPIPLLQLTMDAVVEEEIINP